MASCLNPRTIKRPGLSLKPSSCPSRFWKDTIRPYMSDSIVVPCGKCIACLKNKQNSMVVRIKREAEKRGSFAFVTLTYDEEHIPIAQSFWKVSRDTGVLTCLSPAEVVSCARIPRSELVSLFAHKPGSSHPRFIDRTIFSDDESDYFTRLTPSVCRQDFRYWLKSARVAYERANGVKLDFSYCCVQEYGPRTCRPHMHLALLGLSSEQVFFLLERWKPYGFYKVSFVNPLDKSKSQDPYSAVSFYIGKYMSKGKFECDSVKDCTAEKPRVCQSIGLGTKDLDSIRDYVCCFDMVGRYDLNSLYKSDGKSLDSNEINLLCEEIPKRLVYRLNEKIVLPLPRLIRNKIFYQKDFYEKPCKTALWYLVSDSISRKSAGLRQQEFEEFCSRYPGRTRSEIISLYEDFKKNNSLLFAKSLEADLLMFYSKSLF